MEPRTLRLPVRTAREIRQVSAQKSRVEGRHRLGVAQLFPPSFVAANTMLTTFDELLQRCPYPASGSPEEWSRWEACVYENTRFGSWRQMCVAASKSWVLRELGLPETPVSEPGQFPLPDPSAESQINKPATSAHTGSDDESAIQLVSGEEEEAQLGIDLIKEIFAEEDEDPLVTGDNDLTSTEDDDGRGWWFDGILKQPLPNGTYALYYVDSGWLWNDTSKFIGYVHPKSDLVERDGYFVPLDRVQKEVDKILSLADWGTSDSARTTSNWPEWFKLHGWDVTSPTYKNLREREKPGFLNEIAAAGRHASDLAQTAVEHNATGAPALRVGTQAVAVGKSFTVTILNNGDAIYYSGLSAYWFGKRELHHPVFKMILRAMDDAGVLSKAGGKLRSTPQSLVEMSAKTHREIIHFAWNRAYPHLRNRRDVAKFLRDSENPQKAAEKLLNQMEDFYEIVLKTKPNILNDIRNSIDDLREATGLTRKALKKTSK